MIIDRRKIGLSTDINVIKYFKRYKKYLAGENRQHVDQDTDLSANRPLEMQEPGIFFDQDTGTYDAVTAGNDRWMRGDIIEALEWEDFLSAMIGTGAGEDSEEEEDILEWDSEDKVILEVLFKDLQLPNLTKKSNDSSDVSIVRSGYSLNGGNLDLMKTFFTSFARRMAIKAPIIDELKKAKRSKKNKVRVIELEEQIKKIPFIDEIDVRYRRYDTEVVPTSKMVIFLLLDVSGSMGLKERKVAKLFSKLVVSFLEKKYTHCNIEYIIFSNEAERVNHDNFFFNTKGGGTVLSSAFDLEQHILKEYESSWNVYTMAFSDTELYPEDVEESQDIIREILPLHQYMIYVNVAETSERVLQLLVEPFRKRDDFTFCTVESEEEIITEFIKIFS